MSLPGRACALVAVMALLLAAFEPVGTTGGGCGACPPGCPMHARHLGCHEGHQMSCHHAAPLLGIRSACGHAHDAASSGGTVFRGVLSAVVDEHPQLVDGMTLPPVALFDARPLPEPPTDPPRSSVV